MGAVLRRNRPLDSLEFWFIISSRLNELNFQNGFAPKI